MQGELVNRRTQFSSCDECRRSRVACDASSRSKSTASAGDGARDDGGDGGGEHVDVSCSRCLNRRKPCTFKWVKENKGAAASKKSVTRQRKSRRRRASPTTSEATTTAHTNDVGDAQAPAMQPFQSPNGSDWSPPFVTGAAAATNVVDAQGSGGSSLPFDLGYETTTTSSPLTSGLRLLPPELLTSSESMWLSTIYRGGFSTVFGSWMGRHGNPFVNENPQADKFVNIVELCGKLDRWMANESLHERSDGSDGTAASQDTEQQHRIIDQSLHSTVAAFSARWLPLVSSDAGQDPATGANGSSSSSSSRSIQNLWRYARRDMLRILNRPCYRSMLSLFLFALTPIPAGVAEEEEVDGISGQACVHAALQHIQVLRARQKNLQFSGSKVTPGLKKERTRGSGSMGGQNLLIMPPSTSTMNATSPTGPTGPDPSSNVGTSDFIVAENTAYWAALTFDTSASLTLNCRSLLSSGLFGHDQELPWRLVRSCAKIFDDVAARWQPGSLDITDERANQIVAAGTQWKLLGWKLTAIFKEALRDGHEEARVMRAYTDVVDSISQFNAVFRPRLEACQRRMQFLGQSTKLRWYSLMLHYHLSILMLVDIMEATDRHDLLADVQEAAADAENTVMNTLVFGLHNTYTLTSTPDELSSFAGAPPPLLADQDRGTKTTITVPLTSIDPYPHHIVAGVQLVRKAIQRDYTHGKIADDSYANLQLTLERTVALLPQSSKSVQAVRRQFAEGAGGGGGVGEARGERVVERHLDPYRTMQRHFME